MFLHKQPYYEVMDIVPPNMKYVVELTHLILSFILYRGPSVL